MRLGAAFIALLMFASWASPARSQDWTDYVSFDDYFTVSFPGDPVIRPTTYTTEYGITLPARVYTIRDPSGTYSVTAVDWSTAPKLHETRVAACKASGNKLCVNEASSEIRGSVLYAAGSLLKPENRTIQFAHRNSDKVEGIGVQLSNRDGSRTSAVVHWHENRLYIVEGTSPKGQPVPSLFTVSFGFTDHEGRRVRYDEGPYSPLMPVPGRAR